MATKVAKTNEDISKNCDRWIEQTNKSEYMKSVREKVANNQLILDRHLYIKGM